MKQTGWWVSASSTKKVWATLVGRTVSSSRRRRICRLLKLRTRWGSTASTRVWKWPEARRSLPKVTWRRWLSATVRAPTAPGRVAAGGVLGSTGPRWNVAHPVGLDRGTIARDGERELEFGPDDAITVTLAQDGPRVIDVPTVLAATARLWPTT